MPGGPIFFLRDRAVLFGEAVGVVEEANFVVVVFGAGDRGAIEGDAVEFEQRSLRSLEAHDREIVVDDGLNQRLLGQGEASLRIELELEEFRREGDDLFLVGDRLQFTGSSTMRGIPCAWTSR